MFTRCEDSSRAWLPQHVRISERFLFLFYLRPSAPSAVHILFAVMGSSQEASPRVRSHPRHNEGNGVLDAGGGSLAEGAAAFGTEVFVQFAGGQHEQELFAD